jgi:hypothetical protein
MENQISRQLKAVAERYKGHTYYTGEVNVSDMATDAANEIDRLEEDNDRLNRWVSDLQSGMYVNCVYCGHRYGPEANTPTSMADVLKEHIEHCPKHPMSLLKKENNELKQRLAFYEIRKG